MIEQALQRVYGEASPDTRVSDMRRRRLQVVLAALAVLIGMGVLPLVYAVAPVGLGFAAALQGDVLRHILLNAGANTLVMIWAVRLTGRFDRKLAGALSRAIVVHGVLAFWILIGRQPYSNQIMLLAVGASAVLGPLFVLVRHRALQPRAALLGAWHPLVERVQIACDVVQDPAANLAGYDILLTESVVDLPPDWATALSKAMLTGKSVRLLAEFVEETQGIVSLDHFDLEHLPQAGLTSYRTRKRLMDIGLVLLAAPLAVPVLLLGAALVIATMGRPVMFVQSRVGLGGREFRMFKLRTMANSVGGAARATATRDDVRITPIGRWLRRFRIDELPQLWNVLKGDMSVIGPRPEWTVLSHSYVERLPVYAYRHLVRPGITGWAQVRGGYAADLAETRDKVGYDLFYIKNLSFSLDVQILVRTIWTLLSGSGAR